MRLVLNIRILLQHPSIIICQRSHLFASEPHENISHNALPLAFEHTFLERVQQLEVLLDQKPQTGGKRTTDAGEEGSFPTIFVV